MTALPMQPFLQPCLVWVLICDSLSWPKIIYVFIKIKKWPQLEIYVVIWGDHIWLAFLTGRVIQCNFTGQGTVVPSLSGTKGKGTSSKSCQGTRWARTACQNLGRDVGWDNHYFLSKSGTGRGTGQANTIFFLVLFPDLNWREIIAL